MKILVNDGMPESGIKALIKAGIEVFTESISQEKLIEFINQNNIDGLLVRSSTKVRKDLIDSCSTLKLIGRGGVGMDNIDVEYARGKGLYVINTPEASSRSVAELVFAHLFGMVRYLHDSNRNMPLEGDSRFKELKDQYANGIELKGKTLGVYGLGRIGCEVIKIALGIGMRVITYDAFKPKAKIEVEFFDGQKILFSIDSKSKEELLVNSDFITLHVPAQRNAIIEKKEFDKMKMGVGIVNAARGGVINEVDLLKAIDEGKVKYAGLDVFENEPTPNLRLLMCPNISLTPHIGASTSDAQHKIGIELVNQIKSLLL